MANQEDQNSGDSQPAQKTDGKKNKKMKASSTKGDAIDKGRTLTGSKPDAINMNPIYTHVNNSFEASFGDELNELTIQQRMKKGLMFRRIQGKVQLAKKRSMLKKGSGKVIAKRAKVLAISMIKMKLAGNRKVSDLSPMEKQRVEKLVRGSARVNRLALRLIPSVKKKEAKRFLKKESIDLDNLAEAVAFINEAVNCAAGGGVRGMGHSTGNPDGEPSNYVAANIVDFDKKNDEMLAQKKEFHDKHHAKVTKEDIHDSSYLRLDSKGSTTLLYKNDTPGEPKSSESAIRKAGPKLKKMPKVQEAETREAVPRSGQPRKSIQNVVRDAACRGMSTGPYRQQEVQKKVIDEAKMGNPCWKGYKAYGMKKKNGKQVPNCVPVKEGLDEAFETLDEVAAWQRKEGKRESGGLNQKGVDSYRREHPGSKLKTAVTTKPSELKAGSKAANRRKSFCARMSGMKKQNTSAKTANDPDSRINKSLRKWNC
jgi:hypothetical protein